MAVALAAVSAALMALLALLVRWVSGLRKEANEALRHEMGEERVYRIEACNFFGRLSGDTPR